MISIETSDQAWWVQPDAAVYVKREVEFAQREEEGAPSREREREIRPEPDMKVIHEIMAMDADVEPHGTIEDRGDLDDVLAAIRAETGLSVRRDDFGFESDPEAWYERGEETYEPEEPAFVSDRDIHRIALRRETSRKRAAESHSSWLFTGVGGQSLNKGYIPE